MINSNILVKLNINNFIIIRNELLFIFKTYFFKVTNEQHTHHANIAPFSIAKIYVYVAGQGQAVVGLNIFIHYKFLIIHKIQKLYSRIQKEAKWLKRICQTVVAKMDIRHSTLK